MAGDVEPYRGRQRYSERGYKDRLALGEQVLAGRNNGETMPMISKRLGISHDSALRYMTLVLESRIPPTVELFRRQQNDRLDQTQREIEAQLDAANRIGRKGVEDDNVILMEKAVSMRAQAIALQLRLDERRSKLNGLDSPIRVDIEHTTIDPVDVEMAEMIREAKAQAANQPHEL